MLNSGKDTYILPLPLHVLSENPTGFNFGQLKRVSKMSHSWVLQLVKDESDAKTSGSAQCKVHAQLLCEVYVELLNILSQIQGEYRYSRKLKDIMLYHYMYILPPKMSSKRTVHPKTKMVIIYSPSC